MKILVLIPARGGSKRLPGKNLRPLGGTPLIAWSINSVKGIADICDILVSTDDAAIADAARQAGAQVPWLRPAALATDGASSVDVCLHALDWYESSHGPVNCLLLLQPTSPFRRRATIERGLELFWKHGQRPVIGLSPAQSHPMWCFKIEGEAVLPFIDYDGAPPKSQDLPPAYAINGAFYAIKPADLRKRLSFFGADLVPLVTDDPAEGIDIDTEIDWRLAEAALDSFESQPSGQQQNKQ